MRVRHLLIVSMMVLGLVATPIAANAAVLDWNVEVLVNNVSQGTATASGGILDVTVAPGDTIRFIVGVSALLGSNLTSYVTTVTTDDPAEIDYVVSSGVELTGLNFNSSANANATLNDASPGLGAVNSNAGNVVAGVDYYRLDYIVQTPVTDASTDFTVTGALATAGVTDSATGTASVRFNVAAGPQVPEPATMLLLGSGLAGLAGFGRKKFRK